MSFISDTISKMMGAGTAEEYRKIALDEFCNSNDISNLSVEQTYKLDSSRRSKRFKRQVLFCRGRQRGQNIAFVVGYDEDSGWTEGALIDLRAFTRHRSLAREYKAGETYASSFFSYVVNELGVSKSVSAKETVEPPATPQNPSDPSAESSFTSHRNSERAIVRCPSCGGKNSVPSDGREPKTGKAKCGHCSFSWQIDDSDSKSITYKLQVITRVDGLYKVGEQVFATLEQAKECVDKLRGFK